MIAMNTQPTLAIWTVKKKIKDINDMLKFELDHESGQREDKLMKSLDKKVKKGIAKVKIDGMSR